jgi:hypothetical protein
MIVDVARVELSTNFEGRMVYFCGSQGKHALSRIRNRTQSKRPAGRLPGRIRFAEIRFELL